jgi:antitoxin component YwqK of YwqJK toxin-antitoxin module
LKNIFEKYFCITFKFVDLENKKSMYLYQSHATFDKRPMKFLYILFPVLVITMSSSSCIFSDLFGGNNKDSKLDTVVSAPNLKDIEVQFVDTDSSYSVISYWTDKNGRPLYMKSRQYFVRQAKHGPEKKWAMNGQLIYTALWSNGTATGSIMEYYENGEMKRRVDYDDSKGYPRYEMNFHKDGTKKTDTINYFKGKKEGAINYYSEETGELAETYIYARDTLISIKIYKPEYELLDRQALALLKSMKRDSMERQKKDSLFATLLGNLNSASSKSWSSEENDKEKLEYLELMLKEEKK